MEKLRRVLSGTIVVTGISSWNEVISNMKSLPMFKCPELTDILSKKESITLVKLSVLCDTNIPAQHENKLTNTQIVVQQLELIAINAITMLFFRAVT